MRFCLAIVGIFSLAISSALASSGPNFQSGDIVFQSSKSKQSWAIMWASKSLFSHTGIVEVSGKKIYVIEAIGKVSRTPIEAWVDRGRFGRYALYRMEGLDSSKREAIVKAAKSMLGKKYDIYFTSKNDEIYCSELVEDAYKAANISLGRFEKVKDLDMDNLIARRIVEKRWSGHPLCKGKAKDFESCWALMKEDELVTPISIANDPRLKQIWSNYPLK